MSKDKNSNIISLSERRRSKGLDPIREKIEDNSRAIDETNARVKRINDALFKLDRLIKELNRLKAKADPKNPSS